MSDVQIIRTEVKDNKPHVEIKDVAQQVRKKVLPTEQEAKKRAEEARRYAHTTGADLKREISMDIKNKLSECFDFIEESCGSGAPIFEFYEQSNEVSECVVDGIGQSVKYPIIGRATGVFAPIGVMSRNNRIYDGDHYDYILSNQHLLDRITNRGMIGTIGHHDKKVDDQDLADGKVSHIVTDLHIKEEDDGTRNLYGTLEILDTPAGRLLRTYYDSGMPLFVSSRGGGNLLNVPNESYKRVDKTKYFLETFDIVRNPGFLQAKPVYEKVSESEEEQIDEKVIVATKAHLDSVQAEKDEKKAREKGICIMDAPLDLDGSKAAQKKRLENKLNEDAQGYAVTYTCGNTSEGPITMEKLDELIDKMDRFVSAISESKKEEKEDNEKKEAGEKKEAKEKTEAKEKSETALSEEKKEDKKKEDKLPEDEKNEDEESAVADSVLESEEPTLNKGAQRMYDKFVDPTKGLTKKEVEAGNVQTNFAQDPTFRAGLKQAMQDGAYARNKQKYEDEKARKMAKEQEINKPQEQQKAKQMTLFNKDTIKEELQKRVVVVQGAGETSGEAQEAENKPKEPVTLDHLDLARALKERAKEGKNK